MRLWSLNIVACCFRAAAGQGRGSGSSAGRRQRGSDSQQEDVELFSIDSGWNVEALGDMVELLGDSSWSEEAAPSSSGGANDSAPGDDGWSVEAVPSSSGRGSSAAQADGGESDGGESWDHGEEEEHDPWLDEPWDVAMAGGTSSAATGRGNSQQTATFNGRALRKAEQQLLSSLPRHMLRRLEAEQREADEGAPKAPPPCLPASWLAAAQGSFACLISAPRPPSGLAMQQDLGRLLAGCRQPA